MGLGGAWDYVGIIEAAYRVEQPEKTWLADVVASSRPALDSGCGVSGYFVDCTASCRVWGYQASEGSFAQHDTLWSKYIDSFPPEALRVTHLYSNAYAGGLPPVVQEKFVWLRDRASVPLRSVVSVNAIDSSHRGVVVSAFGTSPRARAYSHDALTRLAAHIAAGARLRARLESTAGDAIDRGEAVFDGTRLVHASGPAKTTVARDALRTAVTRADRLRTNRERRDAIEAWKGLVSGRWSIVDSFDRDGRRFVVAHPNEPEPVAASSKKLTPAELRVARAAALGHPDKLIAYELGVTSSTVAALLSRARAKLGVRTRVELVTKLRQEPGSEH